MCHGEEIRADTCRFVPWRQLWNKRARQLSDRNAPSNLVPRLELTLDIGVRGDRLCAAGAHDQADRHAGDHALQMDASRRGAVEVSKVA